MGVKMHLAHVTARLTAEMTAETMEVMMVVMTVLFIRLIGHVVVRRGILVLMAIVVVSGVGVVRRILIVGADVRAALGLVGSGTGWIGKRLRCCQYCMRGCIGCCGGEHAVFLDHTPMYTMRW